MSSIDILCREIMDEIKNGTDESIETIIYDKMIDMYFKGVEKGRALHIKTMCKEMKGKNAAEIYKSYEIKNAELHIISKLEALIDRDYELENLHSIDPKLYKLVCSLANYYNMGFRKYLNYLGFSVPIHIKSRWDQVYHTAF